jgi:hypothetical protein
MCGYLLFVATWFFNELKRFQTWKDINDHEIQIKLFYSIKLSLTDTVRLFFDLKLELIDSLLISFYRFAHRWTW